MKKVALFVVLMLCVFPAMSSYAANLVLNGSFEDEAPVELWPHYGPILNWNNSAGNVGVNTISGPFWDNGYKMHGTQVAFHQQAGILSQDVAGFVSGQQYTLRFLENLRNTGLDMGLAVRLNGTEVVALHTVAVGEFTLVETDLTSPGDGIFTLEFEVVVNSGDVTFVLDGVSIVPKGEENPFPPAALPERPDLIIANGSFEDEAMNPTSPHYGSVIWWTGLNGMNDNTGPFWDNGVENHGDQIAFRQNAGTVSQTAVGFEAGKQYTLRFSENSRNCCPPEAVPIMQMEVKLNSVVLVANHEVLAGEFEHISVDFASPGTGDYLLEFVITNPSGGDATVLLDAVSIVVQGAENPYPTKEPTSVINWTQYEKD